MPRIFSTDNMTMAARSWMHDIMLAGGIIKNQRSETPSFRNTFIDASQIICTELIERNFADIDNAIREVSHRSFRASLTNTGKWKSFKPEDTAKAIVYLAECLSLYWDDTIRTPYEIDEFKKTLLGEAVYRYGRVLSLAGGPARTRKTSGTAANNGQAAQPKNNYKSSGPQSGNVRDLQGTPNVKCYADTSLIYKIIGDNPQSKNIPNAFIKPLNANAGVNGTNKVFISSGNGYGDCTCFFDDPNEAQKFLDKIVAAGRVPANVTNMRVVKKPAEKNGYFLVGTEFGVCAVSAKALNESMENVEEAFGSPAGWERATEGYSNKELDELHTFMRRG